MLPSLSKITLKSYIYIALLLVTLIVGLVISKEQEKKLKLPVYSPNNSEMILVENLVQLKSALDKNVRIIFVKPGHYFDTKKSNNIITLTGSGTKKSPRYLIYYDPKNPSDNTHPVHMLPSKQAIFRNIWLKAASYWIIDRLTIEKSTVKNQIVGSGKIGREDVESNGRPIQAGTNGDFIPSSYNILNRMLYQQASDDVIVIYEGCHYNTIQNSVLRKNTLPDEDWVGIVLQAWHGRAQYSEIIGTLIKNNEIYDINDGIQLFDHEKMIKYPDYRQTKIINNDIYITPNIYTDGKGKLTSKGAFSAAENAIDIKAGTTSTDPKDTIKIEKNRMWGMRLLDKNIAGSNDHGSVILLHKSPRRNSIASGNIHITDNIIMDALNGVTLQGLSGIILKDNIIYDIKQMGHNGKIFKYENSAALTIIGKGHTVSNNLLINGDHLWLWSNDSNDWTFKDNTLINFPQYYVSESSKVIANNNKYYNTPQLATPGVNDKVSTKNLQPNYKTKKIKRKLLTKPETISIPYGNINTNWCSWC